MSLSRSVLRRRSRTASAPILARKPSWYFSRASAYSCSERAWPSLSGVSPDWITTQSW